MMHKTGERRRKSAEASSENEIVHKWKRNTILQNKNGKQRKIAQPRSHTQTFRRPCVAGAATSRNETATRIGEIRAAKYGE